MWLDRIFRVLAPRMWQDTTAKIAGFALLSGLFNVAYYRVADGALLRGFGSYLLNGIVVSLPFVIFFYLVARYQTRLLRELHQMSRTDVLTGLPNRRSFMTLADRANKASKRGVLFVIDADFFKHINDTYGHAVGDLCLKTIAYRLQRNLRDEDVVGRIGGEEFAIFLSGATIEQARVIGERMCQAIPYNGGSGHEHLSVTLSAGAAIAHPTKSLEELLKQADNALYRAKQSGRARLVVWQPDMRLAG